MRRLVFGLIVGLSISNGLLAQSITVTAEAVETVRLKPDQAKIYLGVETKDGGAVTAVEANEAARKGLIAAVDKLGLKGSKTTLLQQKLTKDRDNSARLRGGFPGGGGAPIPPVPEVYTVYQPVVFTVTEADPVKLVESVEKVLQAAASMGVTGDRGNTDYGYSPFGETRTGARVSYSVKGGWDDANSEALSKATERAMRSAEALAKGAGLKLGDVVTIEDLSKGSGGAVSDPDYIGYRGGLVSVSEDEILTDGELIRKVRVRVKVAASKK